jgi:hypothetical protein
MATATTTARGWKMRSHYAVISFLSGNASGDGSKLQTTRLA